MTQIQRKSGVCLLLVPSALQVPIVITFLFLSIVLLQRHSFSEIVIHSTMHIVIFAAQECVLSNLVVYGKLTMI